MASYKLRMIEDVLKSDDSLFGGDEAWRSLEDGAKKGG